jgi:hypothetical protein
MKRLLIIHKIIIILLLSRINAQYLHDNFRLPMAKFNNEHPMPNKDWYDFFEPIEMIDKYNNLRKLIVTDKDEKVVYIYERGKSYRPSDRKLTKIERYSDNRNYSNVKLKYDDDNRLIEVREDRGLKEVNILSYNDEGLLVRNDGYMGKDNGQWMAHLYKYDKNGKVKLIEVYVEKLLHHYFIFSYDNLNEDEDMMVEEFLADGKWIKTLVYWDYKNPMKYHAFQGGKIAKDGKAMRAAYIYYFDDSGQYNGYDFKVGGKTKNSKKIKYDNEGLIQSIEVFEWNDDWGGKLEKKFHFKFDFIF